MILPRKRLPGSLEPDYHLLTSILFQAEIKALIMARFDKFMAEKNSAPQTNGHTSRVKSEPSESPENMTKASASPAPKTKTKHESDDDDLSDAPTEPSPKKKRKVKKFVDEDAAFAAKLQAEENTRARPTRNGANKKIAVKKSRPKKKTAAKVKNEDDSDIGDSGSGAAEKNINRSGAFHVRSSKSLSTPFPSPSPPLSPVRNPAIQITKPLPFSHHTETLHPLLPSLKPPRRRNSALPPPNRQENLGVRPRARPTGSNR